MEYYFYCVLGIVELFPCSYAFGCRQVVLNTGRKAPYQGGTGLRYFELKIIGGEEAYIVSIVN